MAIIFVILGVAPFVLGYYINVWTQAGTLTMSDTMISVLFLIAWFVLAFLCGLITRRVAQVAGCINVVVFVDLVVIGFEVLLFSKMFDGEVGAFSQMYFAPSIAAGKAVAALVPVEQNYFYQACGAFVLMLVVAFFGALFGRILRGGKKKAKKKAEKKAEEARLAAEEAQEVKKTAEEKIADAREAAYEEPTEIKVGSDEVLEDAAAKAAAKYEDAADSAAEIIN